jgi:hypothetical protein
MVQQIGEQRRSFVATSLSRGDDGWYQHEAEYDVFEMWNDVARHFALDPERVGISGYSMGGYATYRLGTLYPDLFGAAFTQVGPPGEGIWVPPLPPTGSYRGNDFGTSGGTDGAPETLTNTWLENARNLPYLNLAAALDELVPVAGPRAQNIGAPEIGIRGFDQLGYRYRFLLFPTADHLALAVIDDYPMAADFLGDAFVDRDPPHITFAYVPAADDASLGLVHNHAYWVSGMRLADSGQPVPKGAIDAFSHAFGLGDPSSVAGTTTGTAPLPYTEFNRTWSEPPRIPQANRLDLTLTNLAEATVDTARAGIDGCRPLTLAGSTDSAARLLLAGYEASSATGAAYEPAGGGTVVILQPGEFNVTLGAACPADLTISHLFVFDADGKLGTKVGIAAVVRNEGPTAAPASSTTFVLDGNIPIADAATAAMAPGEAALILLTWNSGTLSGEHLLSAIADSSNQVVEIEETNNERSRKLTLHLNTSRS